MIRNDLGKESNCNQESSRCKLISSFLSSPPPSSLSLWNSKMKRPEPAARGAVRSPNGSCLFGHTTKPEGRETPPDTGDWEGKDKAQGYKA